MPRELCGLPDRNAETRSGRFDDTRNFPIGVTDEQHRPPAGKNSIELAGHDQPLEHRQTGSTSAHRRRPGYRSARPGLKRQEFEVGQTAVEHGLLERDHAGARADHQKYDVRIRAA